MLKSSKRRAGFTLIELMIVVAIIGILAALAIPAFLGYVRRSKATEVTTQLDNIFKSMTSFYETEQASSEALDAAQTTHCTLAAVPFASAVPDATPGTTKRKWPDNTTGPWLSIKGAISGYVYYSYYYDARPEGCGVSANEDSVYTLRGAGDLDGDGTLSEFSMAVGTDGTNRMYRARAMRIVNELE